MASDPVEPGADPAPMTAPFPVANSSQRLPGGSPIPSLEEAYEACRQETAEWAKTFYLGTLLMPPAKRRAIWAIYVWCRRTDELMDSPEAQA